MTHTSQQVHIIRGVIPGGRGRGALVPPQLFANSNTLTLTISEVHVDLNIIWSHIKSQYCRSTAAPFCTRKVTSPPPNFQVEITPLKMTHTSQQVYTMTHTRQQVHTMTHTRQL